MKPPCHHNPVDWLCKIVGVDIMELPKTSYGKHYVVVFQHFLSMSPMVLAVPDQKTKRLAQLLALLSNLGTILCHLMTSVCQLLGVKKLNTTSYHPQCTGLVERFNWTLQTML